MRVNPRYLAPLAGAAIACASHAGQESPAPTSLAGAESSFAELRALRDRIAVTTDAGLRQTADGVPLARLASRHDSLRPIVAARLAAIDSRSLGAEDRRALSVMRARLGQDLTLVGASTGSPEKAQAVPSCSYNPRAIASVSYGLDSLRGRVYACYGWAQ